MSLSFTTVFYFIRKTESMQYYDNSVENNLTIINFFCNSSKIFLTNIF